MRYSILVPVYNVEKYLKQCIESIMQQEETDYELILVNDGSTDGSLSICKEYAEKDNRIVVYSKENEGLLLTRRYSVRRARGEYVLFLDSDDYWESGILTRLNRAIEDSDADIILYRYRRVRDDGALVYEDRNVFPDKTLFQGESKEKFIKEFVSTSRLNTMWSKCVKRSIIDVDEDYTKFKDKKGEDLLQSIALVENASTIYYINDVLYNYRLSETGRGRNFKLKYITDYETVREHVYSKLRNMNLSVETINLFLRRFIEGIMLFMNSISRASGNYGNFKKNCEMVEGFKLYKESVDIVKESELSNKAKGNYRLFRKKQYRLLYMKTYLYNTIKNHVKIRGTGLEKVAIKYDLYRARGGASRGLLISTFLTNRTFRRVYYYRKYQQVGSLRRRIIQILTFFLNRKMSIELPWNAKVGKGILFLHPYGITLNSKCVIGDNCTILKGVTIGNTKGANGGVPTIGNNVYIGLNSTVVGNITVGNDVMIAPNTYVNFNVPDGALVLGSPGVIHKKEKASKDYIINSIEEMMQ